MDQIGLIRRIDGLGRIVLPKEIRKSLRIQSGECFEVFLKENEIVLKKYSLMSKYPELLEYLIEIIAELYKSVFILTDMNKIIYISSKANVDFAEEDLIDSYIKIINFGNRKIDNKNLFISNDIELNENYIIDPFSVNGDIVGSIILLKQEKITNVDISTLDLIHKILIKYLEE